jgi:hypothetical protein
MSDDQDFSAIFGPCAKHSEYAVGQWIKYCSPEGRIKTGEIDWITPASADHPLEYWLNGFDVAYQTDILGVVEDEELEDTITLVLCPYCHRTHAAEGVEWCRQRYGKAEQP